MGFEGAIADNFVVWLRSVVGIGILHSVFARVPATSLFFRPVGVGREAPVIYPPGSVRPFPNLLT
jgi:hypothetical protein